MTEQQISPRRVGLLGRLVQAVTLAIVAVYVVGAVTGRWSWWLPWTLAHRFVEQPPRPLHFRG